MFFKLFTYFLEKWRRKLTREKIPPEILESTEKIGLLLLMK